MMKFNKRVALNSVVRKVGAGMAFASDDSNVSQYIKDAWDELYYHFFRATGFDIKNMADNLGYEVGLDFVERVGCLDRLCKFAVDMYEREIKILVGKTEGSELVSALSGRVA